MGPSASIPLPEELSTQQIAALDEWLRLLGRASRSGSDEWILSIDRYEQLGLDYAEGASCAFWITYRKEMDLEQFAGTEVHNDPRLRKDLEEEQLGFHNLLGFDVKYRLELNAGCDGAIDHQILGRLAVALAERYHGVIDMNGEIPLNRRLLADYDSPYNAGIAPEEVRRELVMTYLRRFPGTVLEMEVHVPPDRYVLRHLVDVAFLRAWMEHPYFSMGK